MLFLHVREIVLRVKRSRGPFFLKSCGGGSGMSVLERLKLCLLLRGPAHASCDIRGKLVCGFPWTFLGSCTGIEVLMFSTPLAPDRFVQSATSARPGLPERQSPTASSRRLGTWDYAGMLLGFLLTLTATCVLSHGRIFWEDETLGWMLLHDPSWHHMVQAWKTGADGGGFTFYLIGRGWFRVFGSSDLAFRLYSATCFGLAFAATWAAARRFYPTGIVALALFNTWFFSPPFTLHMREGRFYGLLILGVSLAFWLALVLAEVPRPTPRRFYLLLFLVHGLLTTSHLLGVVFSFFLLAAIVVLDRLQHRSRPLLYLSGALAWLLLLPERANIIASANVGKPHFWTRPPNRWDVLSVYTASSPEITIVLAALFCLVACGLLWGLRSGQGNALSAAYRERRPVYIVTGALMLVPVAFLLEGLVSAWLFNNRYLLPITVAVVYVTAEGLQLLRSMLPIRLFRRDKGIHFALRWLGGAAVAGWAALLLFWVFHHVKEFSPSAPEYTAQLTAMLPKGVPVLCEDAFTFTELIGRQHASGVRYTYLLDWPQSISDSAPKLEITQYHLMEIWRKVGYFSGSIEPIDQFLAHNNTFFVVHAGPAVPSGFPPEIGNPLARRFAQNSAYTVRPYAHLDRSGGVRDTVWLVSRKVAASTR